MHAMPGPAPRPPPPPEHDGCEYGTPMICRVLRSMPLPSSFDIHQVLPRSREMNSERPPSRMVLGLCGDNLMGEFQLNWTSVFGLALMMFARPPPGPCGGPSPPGSAAAAPPPPPPPRPPPRPPPLFGLMLRCSPVFMSYRLMPA